MGCLLRHPTLVRRMISLVGVLWVWHRSGVALERRTEPALSPDLRAKPSTPHRISIGNDIRKPFGVRENTEGIRRHGGRLTGMSEEAMRPDAVEAPEPEDDDNDAEAITQPTKLIRIASMTRAMLDEVRQSPLDEPGRERLRRIHQRSLEELREVLSSDLQEEFNTIFEPLTGDRVPSEAELRVAQAQLIGWLEGLFHGIQASLFSQQMAAQAQLAEMQKRAIPAGRPQQGDEPTGLYL